jgi:hypothetical protein
MYTVCVLHNTVIDKEGLDEELQNHEDSFSTNLDEPERQVTRSNNISNLRVRRVRFAFTVYFNSDVGRLPENSHWLLQCRRMCNRQRRNYV